MATAGLWLRAFVTRVYCRALVNTHWCCVPSLNKLPFFLSETIPNNRGTGNIKSIASYESMKSSTLISRPVTWRYFGVFSCVWQTDGLLGPHRYWSTSIQGWHTPNFVVSGLEASPLRLLVRTCEAVGAFCNLKWMHSLFLVHSNLL